jgi:hypothetical protein
MSNIIAATGAREFFSLPQAEDALAELREFIAVNNNALWLVGGAEGWDFAVMREVAKAGQKFTLCLPNDGYLGYYLPKWTVREHAAVFESLASQAHKVVTVADKLYEPSRDPRDGGRSVHSNFLRNQYMVDYADHIVSFWTGKQSGGTVHALRYAQYKQVPMTHLGQQYK